MSMRPTDRIIGPSRGTAAAAKASFRNRGAQRIKDVEAYVDAVYLLCMSDDMPDAAIVISAADVETGTFTNKWWKERLNAGSLGVTGWGPDDEVSPTFTTGAHAAKAHVAHLLLYATGQIDRGGMQPSDDPRFAAYREAYGSRAFPTLNDLSGRYAADTGYGATIARRSQVVYGDLPDQSAPTQETPPMAITFGRVPHPAYQDRPIRKAEGRGQDNLGKRSVKGVVWHRILGSLWGTDGYFRNADVNALTDYGVGVAATDGAANDGVILRWNDPLGFQSGWASGTYNGAYGDGKAFAEKYGVNAINRDQASIEISGQYTTPLSEQARDAIAGITAYWADQYRIPWDVFPIAPQDGFSFVRWHQEFTLGTGKVCPGAVVISETPALIERTRAILKKHQTAGASPQPEPVPDPEPEPQPEPPKEHTLPEGLTWQLVARLFNPLNVKDPDTGKKFTFSKNSRTSMAWLEHALGTIPAGKPWHAGQFGPLVEIIRRGDGGRVYQFVGFTHPVGPEPEQDAA
jgi:hypothetical protein